MVEITERMLKNAKAGGWIGVDLDGTCFIYDKWVGWNIFGDPIWPMINRMKAWVAAGIDTRIFTARVGLPAEYDGRLIPNGMAHHVCRVTGERFSDRMMVRAIQDKLETVGLPRLKVQCFKDVDMIEFWDDRAIQVVANTGRTLAEEHAAEIEALRGKQYGGDAMSRPYTLPASASHGER